jgi:hypothetical protein
MRPHRLVRFIKDCKVEYHTRLSCCCSKFAAALVGREYDLGSIGVSAKKGRNLTWISMRRQPQIIDFTNKFIAFKVADCLIAANAQPIWLNTVCKKLAGPIGKALANQCKARHGNENGFGFKRIRDPIRCKSPKLGGNIR